MNLDEMWKRYRNFLFDHNLTAFEAVITSGGAAMYYGLREETNDLDLIVSKKFFDSITDKEVFAAPIAGTNWLRRIIPNFEPGVDLIANDEIPNQEREAGAGVQHIAGLIEFKKGIGRPIDLEENRRLQSILDRAKPKAGLKIGDLELQIFTWMVRCFGVGIARNKRERDLRFAEEAVELIQARGNMSREEMHRMVDRVFDRPPGEEHQEAGGAMMTLAALGCTLDPVGEDQDPMTLEKASMMELARISDPEIMVQIRHKNERKRAEDVFSILPDLSIGKGLTFGEAIQIVRNHGKGFVVKDGIINDKGMQYTIGLAGDVLWTAGNTVGGFARRVDLPKDSDTGYAVYERLAADSPLLV